jgi:hypothetical protein
MPGHGTTFIEGRKDMKCTISNRAIGKVEFTKKMQVGLDEVKGQIRGHERDPLPDVDVRVKECTYIGRLLNRSLDTLEEIGIVVAIDGEVGDEFDWDASEVTFTAELHGYVVGDLPYLVELLQRLCNRGTRKTTGSKHPFSLYDLKQATKLIWDGSHEVGGAEDTLAWLDEKELQTLKGSRDALRPDER